MASGRLRVASKAAIYFSVLFIAFSIDGVNHCGVDENAVIGVRALQQGLQEGQLSDGDLVFRTGRDLMSRLVLSQGGSPRFSHVGIILALDNGIFVVHAIPRGVSTAGGVLMEPLNSFGSFENASDVGFFRIKGMNADTRRKVHEYVLQQIGKPFDYEFLFSEEDRFYCTELVLKALAAAGMDIAGSLQHITVMLLSEPLVPPDYIRRSTQLDMILPNEPFHRIAQKAGSR